MLTLCLAVILLAPVWQTPVRTPALERRVAKVEKRLTVTVKRVERLEGESPATRRIDRRVKRIERKLDNLIAEVKPAIARGKRVEASVKKLEAK